MNIRRATGNLDRAECSVHLNEIMPSSNDEVGELTYEEKDKGSDLTSLNSAESMINDGVIMQEEGYSQSLKLQMILNKTIMIICEVSCIVYRSVNMDITCSSSSIYQCGTFHNR